jgi:transglutaminase-like putative cysteine protease
MFERLKLPEGWSSFFLLLTMLVNTALSISAARWTGGLEHLATVAILALIAGLLLAKSRFPAIIAHLFSLFYGFFAICYVVSRMVDQPTWRERVVELGERAATWLTKATTGGTSRDSLMFVLLLSVLFWFLGHVAAWYTFRRPRLWRAVLPIGLTLLVNQYVYTDPRIATRSTASLVPFIIIFLLSALLYVVRTNVYLHELDWQSAHVNYSTEVRLDFVRAGAILAVVALLVMAIAPGARAGPNLSNLWGGIEDIRNSLRDTVTRLFGSLDTYGRGLANPFTNRTVLGGPRNLGNEVLFDVSAPGGRYWRAIVYDRYTGDSWLNTDDHKALLPPGEALSSDAWLARREVTQTVTVYLPSSTQLFAAPEPLRVPGLSTRASISFEQGQMSPASTLHSRKTLYPGNAYQVVSLVSRADPDSLRAAGLTYPDWIARRYLQLPDTVTDRTRALAQEITADQETVFDKAQALEEYLRQNLRYDLDVPAPPEDHDFVDFVLFDLQAGYCDYYASSFVVMARSLGIPARIAYGYAQDEYDEEAEAYRVRAKNGHSWPEVFFPEYGWIQLEPTVVVDPINWPAPPRDPNAATNSDPGDESDAVDPREEKERDIPEEPDLLPGSALDLSAESSRGFSPLFLVLVGLLLIAGLGMGVTYWTIEARGMSGLNLIERAYARMWRFAARLGVPGPPDQTPHERAEALATLVPEGRAPIQSITDMYVIERFGRGNGNGDGSSAEDRWALLRPVLWKAWLQKKFSRFQQQDKQRRWRDFYGTRQAGDRAETRRRAEK